MRASGKIKLDFKFTVHLQRAIFGGELIPAKNSAGDWLSTLSDAELQSLTKMVEASPGDDDSIDHIYTLILTLTSLESGQPLSISKVEAVEELIPRFNLLIRLESLRRQGLIRLAKTLSLDGDLGGIEITESGLQSAADIKALLGS
jgi:hypothetical protein